MVESVVAFGVLLAAAVAVGAVGILLMELLDKVERRLEHDAPQVRAWRDAGRAYGHG